MYLPNDNDMLYSMVNMKLRDQYESLDELCDCEDLDPAMLLVRLNAAGYQYDEEHNKFSPILDFPELDEAAATAAEETNNTPDLTTEKATTPTTDNAD